MTNKIWVPGTVVDSPWLNDVNTATYDYLTAVTGTNTITATGPVAWANVAGNNFYFIPALTNTGPVTLNINGVGAKSINKAVNGVPTALVAGDLVLLCPAEIVFDGSVFWLLNPQSALVFPNQPGRLIGVQTFTASGTYTATAGTVRVLVKAMGSGGGGGGCAVTGAATISVGGGGGGGGYSETFLTSGFSGTTVTIGAGGVANIGSGGSQGGTTSFGAFISITGAGGGLPGTPGAQTSANGGQGGVASGGTIVNAAGPNAYPTVASSATLVFMGGAGANSAMGGGGSGGIANNTNQSLPTQASTGFGAGGGGACSGFSQPAIQGAAGRPGIIIVYEYA